MLLTLGVALTVSLLPDLDAVAGLLLGDMYNIHNQGSHSLFSGLLASILIAAAVNWFGHRFWGLDVPKGKLFWLSLTAYALHVLMDTLTPGRGVMLFWPFSTVRFQSPVPLLYGVRWEEGWLSLKHLWTIVSELGLILLLLSSVQAFVWLLKKARSDR